MSTEVQFEEDNIGGMNQQQLVSRMRERQGRMSPVIAFLIRTKIFKRERDAQAVILLLALIVFTIGVYFLYQSTQTPEVIELRVHIR